MGATIIVDAFWGDAGKGKMSAYLARELNADLAIRAGTGTNAGHSVFTEDPYSFRCNRMLPLAHLNESTELLISSGVVVDPSIVLDEIITNHIVTKRVMIDYRCSIIEEYASLQEKMHNNMQRIGSTMSGSGIARSERVMRVGKLARDCSNLKPFLVDGIDIANNMAKNGTVIIEGSQGSMLSLYSSPRYPYVTSDNCNTASFLDDASLNWQLLDRVILLVKCLPTCVGNGPLPYEMDTKEIQNRGLVEHGIVTGRLKRRSEEIDFELLRKIVTLNGATEIALTFCDQLDTTMVGLRDKSKVTNTIRHLKNTVEAVTNVPVTFLSTGKFLYDMIYVGE